MMLLAGCSSERLQMLNGVLSDVFWPVYEWPLHEARRFLGPRVGFDDRASISKFLLGNGLPPSVIVQWAKAQPGWLRHRESALDMANLIKKHADGKWEDQCKQTWSLQLKQKVVVYTPNYAFEEIGNPKLDYKPGRQFWTEAITELQEYAKTLPCKR